MHAFRSMTAWQQRGAALVAVLAVTSLATAVSSAITGLSVPSAGSGARAQGIESNTWTIVPQAGGNVGVTFSLGWTLGTHEGRASRVSGSVQAQPNPLTITQGEFRVPIASISTGSPTRDCHLREALGIDYARSRFPAEHVCVNDQLPASGADAVVFPDIVIRIGGMRPNQADTRPTSLSRAPAQPLDAQVLLTLSIHGRDRDLWVPVRLRWIEPDSVQVEARFDVKLADFGVVVKMPPLLGVDDHTTIRLMLLLRSRAAA